MKRKKWTSIFLTAMLLMTVVINTGNTALASEILEEDTAEEIEKTADVPGDMEEEADNKEKTEETKETETSDQEIVGDNEMKSASEEEELDIETESNIETNVEDGLDEEEILQKTDGVEEDLVENPDVEKEIEQVTDELKENLDRVVMESMDHTENEEESGEETAPYAGDIASGSEGNVTWVIDGDGKLTVSGEGVFSSKLWKEYADQVVSVDLSGVDTRNVTDMSEMFADCINLKSFDLSGLDTSNVTTMREMFRSCSSLESLDLSGLNTSNVTDMYGMFRGCSSLAGLDLSNFDTSNVKEMDTMFYGCNNLISIDLSNFNTSNLQSLTGMFYGCHKLVNLDLSSFNTSNITNMLCVFFECNSLIRLDLSNFDTSNVTNMESMFGRCSSLIDLNLSSFDTSNVENMYGMFGYCSSLTNLDLSSFNVFKSNGYGIEYLFVDCNNLNLIHTPYNVQGPQNTLPLTEGYTWYLPDGTEVTELPANLDHSVMIVRRKNPKIVTTTTDLNMEDVVRVKYVPYSYTVETNNTESDNIVTYSIVEGRLAEGLSLYPATGEIYGVPLETGSFPIRVKAEFSNPEYFPSYADLVLTVIDNTESNIFNASDPGYELEVPIGEITSGYGFVVTELEDLLFVSAGAYSEFIDLWLNGQKLTEGEDYTKESGSTRITIRSQTFLNKADKEGVNTLAAEFREGGLLENPLRRTAQNFRLQIQQNSGTSGNESSGNGYTGGGDSQDSGSTIPTANFAIRLVDAAGNALGGYTVELHSEPKVTRTNQKGIAVFRNVEEGSHTLYVKDGKGNILASKVFTLGIGGGLSLDGDQITAKDGAAFTLQLQMTGSMLTLLQVQEGDVYRIISAQTGDEANPELWLAFLALLGTAALAAGVSAKRRNYR